MLQRLIFGEFIANMDISSGLFWFIAKYILVFTVIFILYTEYSKFRFVLVCIRSVIVLLPFVIYYIPQWIIRGRRMDNFNMAPPVFTKVWKWTFEIDLNIQGVGNVPDDTPCIVVCNHQNAMDAFTGVVGLYPVLKKCVAIVKWECHYLFLVGQIMWLAGFCFIKRSDPAQYTQAMNEAISDIKKEKGKMWIFPEGRRNGNNNLLPFKKSAFRLALEHQLPIIPVVISPYSYPRDEKIPNSHVVIARILPKILTDNMRCSEEQVDRLTKSTWELMNNEFHKLDIEITEITGHSPVYCSLKDQISKQQ